MSNPTNTDIMNAIITLNGEVAVVKGEVAVVKQIAEATRTQAEKTNGRVNSIEQWKNGLEAIDRYKKDNPTQQINAPNASTVVVRPRWFQNKQLATGAAGILLAIATAIGVIVGRVWGGQ